MSGLITLITGSPAGFFQMAVATSILILSERGTRPGGVSYEKGEEGEDLSRRGYQGFPPDPYEVSLTHHRNHPIAVYN